MFVFQGSKHQIASGRLSSMLSHLDYEKVTVITDATAAANLEIHLGE